MITGYQVPYPRKQLTTPMVLDLVEHLTGQRIKTTTWHTYTSRIPGQGVTAPKPDGYFGATAWWYTKTITDWLKTRPGQGKGGGRPRNVAADA